MENFTEQDIAAAIVEKTLERQESGDPQEIAANLFGLYLPKFLILIDKLSIKALRRLIKMLVAEPLEPLGLKPISETEKNAYSIGDRLLEAKYTMIISTFFNKAMEAYNEEQKTVTTVVAEEQTTKTEEKTENG